MDGKSGMYENDLVKGGAPISRDASDLSSSVNAELI